MKESPDTPEPRRYPVDPWGRYRPTGATAALIRICRAIPRLPAIKQLVFPLRTLARSRIDGPVDWTLWGHRLRFRAEGNLAEGRLLFLPDRWDHRERSAIEEILEPGDVFVDVGANFGGYTWWVLSRLGSEVRIVAFEPDPELYRALKFNLRTNGCEKVRVVPVAAGTTRCRAELHVHPVNRGENSLLESDADTSARTVEVRPLSELLHEAGLERVDLMKMDIEGMEPAVLRTFFSDAPRTLWPRSLLVEWKETEAHRGMRDRLLELGYRVELETRMNLLLRLDEAG